MSESIDGDRRRLLGAAALMAVAPADLMTIAPVRAQSHKGALADGMTRGNATGSFGSLKQIDAAS